MSKWICETCGTQFAATEVPPELCPICSEERQFVGYHGQRWTTLEQMQSADFMNAFYEHEPGLVGIGTVPRFGIGQRAILVRHPDGNVLWDCISYIDDITTDIIKGLGGIKAVAISHPHYYSAMVEWAERFDCKIYIHEKDREWVMNPNPRIEYWSGDRLKLYRGLKLIHVGGHFAGGTVLHWRDGANGSGVLLTGDIIQVAEDRKRVSFMYSYPNMIPLPIHEVEHIMATIEPLEFERIYGFRFERVVTNDAKNAVLRSGDRYRAALLK